MGSGGREARKTSLLRTKITHLLSSKGISLTFTIIYLIDITRVKDGPVQKTSIRGSLATVFQFLTTNPAKICGFVKHEIRAS